MSLLLLAWRQLLARGAKHLLTVLIVALGVGLMTAAAASVDAARSALSVAASRYPMVIGGEIGAVPLVLGSLTTLQDLSAGVDHALLAELEADARVDAVVPLLAGHAVEGFPLLGTSPDFLQPRERYPLASGRVFEADAHEVVLGSAAASGLELTLGDEIVIEHQHAGAPEEPGTLKVVGILDETRSDADQTMYCPLHAIYASHGHAHGHEVDVDLEVAHEVELEVELEVEPDHAHEAHHDHEAHHAAPRLVSSLLVRPASDAALLALQEELEARPGVEVALTGQTLRRVADQLGTGGRLLEILVSGVVLMTFLSLLLSVYGTAMSQARDLAVMRVIGASRLQVVGVMLLLTLGVVAVGTAAGLGLGAVLGDGAEQVMRRQMGLEATVTLLSPTTLKALGGAMLVLLMVGIQPALEAYSLEVAEALSAMPGSGRAGWAFLRRWSVVFVALGVLVWAQWASGRHGTEEIGVPLDEASALVYDGIAHGTPDEIAAMDGTALTVRGWMYALGDPFEVQDFYLVGMNPRLSRCPFCYRAPTSRERILVRSGGRTLDLTPSLVEVRGTLRTDPAGTDPFVLELEAFEVVIP